MRATTEETHWIMLVAPKKLWRQFQAAMRENDIKTYSGAFHELMRQAADRGNVRPEREEKAKGKS